MSYEGEIPQRNQEIVPEKHTCRKCGHSDTPLVWYCKGGDLCRAKLRTKGKDEPIDTSGYDAEYRTPVAPATEYEHLDKECKKCFYAWIAPCEDAVLPSDIG